MIEIKDDNGSVYSIPEEIAISVFKELAKIDFDYVSDLIYNNIGEKIEDYLKY